MRNLFGLALALTLVLPLRAEEAREFGLSAAPEIVASGLLDYILPRFALKTARRVQLADSGADARLGPDDGTGQPVMARGGVTYAVTLDSGNPAAKVFADWLGSEIGQTAIRAFQPENGPPFESAAVEAAAPQVTITGNAELGRKVAEIHCARCHRVSADSRGIGIGSTPSFPAMKALPDWAERFGRFYALNPHPAFLRVDGLSPPFDPMLPPPIVPVTLSLDEVEAVQAYAAGLTAADLGGEIVNR
ncbi:hypothetical protein [Defluviimonas sp. SAOS-178_SWC]|uniref:hypothetical protein n=1 Tax=Defluviimonas sp. SAOS-178_SWC TaxID=3121287 RepID=UPI003221F6B3